MTGAGSVWIVTEQALRSKYVPKGSLGIELINAFNETKHIKDSM